MSREDKKPEVIDYDTFKSFIESSPLTNGPTQLSVPHKNLYHQDDKISWEISGKNSFPILSVTQFQEIVDQRYEKLKEKYGYGGTKKAFDQLKAQLLEEGKNPEKYGLNDDAYAFNRAYNKRKNKRLRK